MVVVMEGTVVGVVGVVVEVDLVQGLEEVQEVVGVLELKQDVVVELKLATL